MAALRRSHSRVVRDEAGITRVEMERKVAELRRQGKSYEEISKELGVTEKRAIGLGLRAGSKAVLVHQREQEYLLAQELERLDEMQAAIYGQALGVEERIEIEGRGRNRRVVVVKKPDTNLMAMVLEISKHRSNLAGLYAPKRSEVTGRNGGPITIATIDAMLVAQESDTLKPPPPDPSVIDITPEDEAPLLLDAPQDSEECSPTTEPVSQL